MNKKILAIGICALMLLVVFSSGCTGNEKIEIKIICSSGWSGSISDDDGSKSVDGSGGETFEMAGGGIVVAVIQKKGASGTLTVQILEDGEVVETQTTTAEYGVVTVSHSF